MLNFFKRQTSFGPSKPFILVGTLQDLNEMIAHPPSTRTMILLTGELVLLSANDTATPEHYSRQTNRITKSITGFSKKGSAFTLKVWVHKDVLDVQRQLRKHRFAFAIDQYLQLGKAQKFNFKLVTGFSGEHETIIQTFTFNEGNLVGIEGKVLPGLKSSRLQPDFIEYLNNLTKDALPISIASPLINPDDNKFDFASGEIYNRLIQYPIIDDSTLPSIIDAHMIPFLIVLASVIVYFAASIIPFNQYKLITGQFQKLTATLPKDELAFGFEQLKVMQQRRFFLTEEKQQIKTVGLLKEITYALSAENVHIKTIELNTNKVKESDPDILISIQVPRQSNTSVLEQARPIIENLGNRLGITLHLSHNGFQEQRSNTGNVIQYNIEGNFKKAQ